MSSVADAFLEISRKYSEQYLLIDVPYFTKEKIWMSPSDKLTGGKPSSKLTLKTKWKHSCGCWNLETS